MLRLTDYEKRLLGGEMGAFKQKAMEFNVRYANVLGAEAFCPVSRATLFIGAQRYLECYEKDTSYEKIFSEFYLCSGEVVPFGKVADECKAQTCGAACDLFECEKTHFPKDRHERNALFLKAAGDMGVMIVESCTPYLVGWVPLLGEHFVSTESSNVVVSNSLFGARGNSDGVEAAVCAAITARTPAWGMHLPENRYADCRVRIACKAENPFDWDLIGFTVGRLMPKHVVPVVTGDFARPDINALKQFCASIAVTSATEICHIVGVTPEAQTLAMAVGGKRLAHEFEVTQDACAESFEMICAPGSGDVDYVSVGCPHLSLDELRGVARYLEDKRVARGVELFVWTDYATKAMADVNGFTRAIEGVGGHVVTGSCPLVMGRECHAHAKAMAINGAKQAFNMKNQTEAPVYYGDIRRCLDAAVSGRWEERR